MEWMNRAGNRPAQPGQTVAPSTGGAPVPHHGGNGKRKPAKSFGFHYISGLVLLVSIAILSVAVIGFLMFFKTNKENGYVDNDKMQAVFLNGGQVYFGKIRVLNNKYVGMNEIYYLRVNQQVQPKQGQEAQQDISLVKLGCELHGPQDEMFINRDQVVFWENLKGDGEVAKAVEKYKKDNPKGQDCKATGEQNSNNNSNTNSNNNSGNNQNNNATSNNP